MVENLFINESRVAFIVESPYTDEVSSGFPLAGDSGVQISQTLLGIQNIALGKICNDRSFSSNQLFPFSIVNISQLPLEKNAYDPDILPEPSNIDLLVKLKKNIDRQNKKGQVHHEHWVIPKDDNLRILKNELLNECITNIKRLIEINDNIQLAPCGKFARVFVRKALQDQELINTCTMINGLPHPARNQWVNISESKKDDLRNLVVIPAT